MAARGGSRGALAQAYGVFAEKPDDASRKTIGVWACGASSGTPDRVAGMGDTLSFGYEGDRGLGDRLLAPVLRREKTATSSLVVEYLSGEQLPRVGKRFTLVDHDGQPHGIVETTRVKILPMHLVGDDVAHDEGEGFADAAEWRRGHEAFWAEVADLVRADTGDPDWQLREAEPVVGHWFRLVETTVATSGSTESW